MRRFGLKPIIKSDNGLDNGFKPSPKRRILQSSVTLDNGFKPSPKRRILQSSVTLDNGFKPSLIRRILQSSVTLDNGFKPSPKRRILQSSARCAITNTIFVWLSRRAMSEIVTADTPHPHCSGQRTHASMSGFIQKCS